jgi:hypothetical protein
MKNKYIELSIRYMIKYQERRFLILYRFRKIRIMGGPGSGERWHKKGVVEDHYRLDVRELHREHEIKPGDRMTVQYERHGEKLIQQVYFDWTPCNFGGQRPWFICGDCGQRAAIIFGKGKDFA